MPSRVSVHFLVVARRLAAVVALAIGASSSARATVVQFTTSSGKIDVRLYDARTPLTVANFLNYSDNNLYDNTFIHRQISGFVIQGGGFTYNADSNSSVDVAAFGPVKNEPGVFNLRGTIAMAKIGPQQGQPPTDQTINSATDQWFFNLSDDNASNLDNQNGGFTAFGHVVGTGMTVVDAIAALPKFPLDNGNFTDTPLRAVGGANGTIGNRLVYVTDVRKLNLAAGDFTFDGKVNATDLATWKSDFSPLTPADTDGDLDVDGVDFLTWQRNLGLTSSGTTHVTRQQGDANGDGKVSAADFPFFASEFGSTYLNLADADGNGDSEVNGADFLLWQRTLGQNLGAPVSSVPEPAAGVLVMLGAASLAARRRREK